jgi:hypothetical protein
VSNGNAPQSYFLLDVISFTSIRFAPEPFIEVPYSAESGAARRFARMELTAVTCISRTHHTAFLRLPDRDADSLHRWAFYDSMCEIVNGHRVPVLFEVPGLARFFESGCKDASCLRFKEDAPGRDSFVQRLTRNAFMFFYTSQREHE